MQTRKEYIGLWIGIIVMIPALLGITSLLIDGQPVLLILVCNFVAINFGLAWYFSSKRAPADILMLCLIYCVITLITTVVLSILLFFFGLKSGALKFGKIGG